MEERIEELAALLRERRRALGLTRTRLAEKCGLKAADIARWERGDDVPGPDQVIVLAEAVGLSDRELRGWLDLSGPSGESPEVAVALTADAAPAPSPFDRRLKLTHSDEPSLGDRWRSWWHGVRARREHSQAQVAAAGRRSRPAILPETPLADYDPAVIVYSDQPSTYETHAEEQLYLTRRLSTAGFLVVLGIALWWALGALGDGLSEVLDLFRSSDTTPSTLP